MKNGLATATIVVLLSAAGGCGDCGSIVVDGGAIWGSYIGGYEGLAQGDSSTDEYGFCWGSGVYIEYADITIRGISLNDTHCPGHRFYYHCL